MRFVHLHLHSHYSLLDGLSKIDEILDRVSELGMEAVALTDHGVLYGAIEFYTKAKAKGIKPIIGCELYVAPRTLYDKDPARDSSYFHLPVVCQNNTGYHNLLKLVTKAHLEGFYYKPRVDKNILREFHEGLIGFSGCLSGEIPRAILSGDLAKTRQLINEYIKIFGRENFYLELQHHPEIPEQQKANHTLVELAKEFALPLIVTADSHYPKPEDKDVHDILLAVQTGSKIDDAERLTLKGADFSIKSAEGIEKDFKGLEEAIENTWKIAQRCNADIEIGKAILPTFPVPEGKDSESFLRELAEAGLKQRYPAVTKELEGRLEYELSVIQKTGFADYFLIVQDFVNWARQNGIEVGPGRGSVAGSLISYALGITDIDPIQYQLMFERFLTSDRVAPPDIDIDFADDRRDEVIRYIEERYGKENVAQIATFGVMKARLAVRDVARALGLPYSLGDQISKLIPFNFTIEQAIENSRELKDLYQTNPDAKLIMDTARRLEGVVRHASTHAAGIVIAPKPLVEYAPIQNTARGEVGAMTQYDMYSVENIGLLKIDILGLANLTIIKNALRIIHKIYNTEIDWAQIDVNDKKTVEMLARGETTGVFQLEGGGMTRYLKDLKPTSIEDIIVMISLYRPGPLDAGMIPEYIARKHGKKKIDYLDPRLEPILKNTYGIIVYQEQLLQVAQVIAGFSLAQADVLRKAVGKKIKKLLGEQQTKFVDGAVENGLAKEKAKKLWEWFEPFARYGFNRAHAAAYAQIAFRTAYLKAHYPQAFMAALLTADFGNLDRIAIEIAECGRLGIKIVPPNVNRSFVEFGVIPESGDIIFSLAAIKGVGVSVAQAIQEERSNNGPYASLTNFIERIPRFVANKKTIECLAKSGAFDEFAERKQVLSSVDSILRFASLLHREITSSQSGLFGMQMNSGVLKLIPTEPATKMERLAWERELLGLYLSDHPLNGLTAKLTKSVTPIQKITSAMNGKRIRIGGVISVCQRIISRDGRPVLFSQVEDTSSRIEVVVFSDVLEKNPVVWQKDNVVLIEGRLSNRNGDMKIICERAEPIAV